MAPAVHLGWSDAISLSIHPHWRRPGQAWKLARLPRLHGSWRWSSDTAVDDSFSLPDFSDKWYGFSTIYLAARAFANLVIWFTLVSLHVRFRAFVLVTHNPALNGQCALLDS